MAFTVEQPERGRGVHQDVVVDVPHGAQRPLQRALAADHRGQGQLGARQLDAGRGDVDLAGLDDLRHARAPGEHVEHAEVERLDVDALAHGEVALGIEVDGEHPGTEVVEADAEVERRRCLGDAALLVGEGDDAGGSGHLAHLRGGCSWLSPRFAARGAISLRMPVSRGAAPGASDPPTRPPGSGAGSPACAGAGSRGCGRSSRRGAGPRRSRGSCSPPRSGRACGARGR